MISDISGFVDIEYLRYTNTFIPHWLKAKEFAFCHFVIDSEGRIVANHIFESTHKQVPLTSFKDFVGLMMKASHTFVVFNNNEMDACINLHSSPRFKDDLHKGKAWDSTTGLTFYKTSHKLNIRDGNKWCHVLDVSDLSRDSSYRLHQLCTVEEVREFTLKFIWFCINNGLTLGNNFTWSSVARDYLMKYVGHSAWPHWNNLKEVDFQAHFLQGSKGPHHGARAIGTFVGADFDRVRSHLSILSDMPSHAQWCTNYVRSKRFNPDALYASYWIKCNLSQLPFMPWRIRLDDNFTPEVYGEQSVVVLQPNLKSAIRVLGLKEGKDFVVVDSYQVVSNDGGIRYPYRDACRRVLRLLDKAPKGIHLKTMYQRFAGMMFHVIQEKDKLITSNVFDPMLASTIWAEEYAQCWEALMSSVDPQLMRVDGGTAGMPSVDADLYSLGAVGTHLAFNQQFKDKTGETFFRDRIMKNRDLPYLPKVTESMLGFSEAFAHLIPMSEVGKPIKRECPEYPGDQGRKCKEIKHVGELLDGTIITEVFSGEEAMAATKEKKCKKQKWLS